MEIIWDFIRLARHTPPGAAAHDVEAAGVFRAELQQFEELMRAAAAAGPAARPLPLFYALSQAGRAIEAVKGSAGHYGHGLTIDPSADDLMATSIRPVERGTTPGQFQTVAAALSSPIISEPVSLAAIFASLPETANEILETTTELPRPLSVWPASEPIVPTPGWSHILVAFDQTAQTSEDVSATLRSIPQPKAASDKAKPLPDCQPSQENGRREAWPCRCSPRETWTKSHLSTGSTGAAGCGQPSSATPYHLVQS